MEKHAFMNGLVERITPDRVGAGRFLLPGGRGISLVLFTLLTYYAVFRLPFRWPPKLRLWSASYAFGFNNTVAILGLVALLGIVALFYAVRHKRHIPILDFPSDQKPADRRPLRIAFAAMALLYAALTLFCSIFIISERTQG
jgi:hypothetical protein